MPNESLKTALTQAGLTVEEFADIILVDPKTVQRWVSGRTPYPRHRGTISRALDIPEHELWPDTVTAPPAPPAVDDEAPAPAGTAGIRAWAHMLDEGAPNPVALLTDELDEVDLIDPTATLLLEPGMITALQSLTGQGCRVRIITAAVAPGQTLAAHLLQLALRTVSDFPASHVILRVDNTMLLALPLSDAESPPLFRLEHQHASAVFDRWLTYVDSLWERAVAPSAPRPGTTPVEPPLPARPVEAPRQWPRRPN